VHNYFNVKNIITYYTLKKSLCTIILTIFYYYFYLSNIQNNIQMLHFYTDLNAIIIKIYMHKHNTAIG